ncbi:uncharacterized protein J3R85_013847 [Psidium guajava]|nr:uncharacterized protein J3R85_013847 [Psidium guajava]
MAAVEGQFQPTNSFPGPAAKLGERHEYMVNNPPIQGRAHRIRRSSRPSVHPCTASMRQQQIAITSAGFADLSSSPSTHQVNQKIQGLSPSTEKIIPGAATDQLNHMKAGGLRKGQPQRAEYHAARDQVSKGPVVPRSSSPSAVEESLGGPAPSTATKWALNQQGERTVTRR